MSTENAIGDIGYTLVGGKTLNCVIDGTAYAVRADSPNFRLLVMSLLAQDWEKARQFATVQAAIKEYMSEAGLVVEDNGKSISWNGKKLHGILCDKIAQAMSEGQDAKPFINFLEKLQQNPSDNSRDQLFLFVEQCGLTVTPEGNFLGYKAIRADWTDMHSGKFDNRIGNTISMLRSNVTDTPDITCGPGLHVGTLEYARDFMSGPRIVIVEVDPKNVVSVPRDHGNAKMRCCEYRVVGEYTRKLDEAVCYDYSETQPGENTDIAEQLGLVNHDTEIEYCTGCDCPINECECEKE